MAIVGAGLMRSKRIRGILTVSVVLLTVWQVFNISYFWGQFRSVRLGNLHDFEKTLAVSSSLFSDRVANEDQEAADLASYVFLPKTSLDELSELVFKYPTNEFLISRLAEESLQEASLGPAISELLIDRLIKRFPENAYYSYLKANLAARVKGASESHQVLDAVAEGNNKQKFAAPFALYRDRILRIMKCEWLEPAYLWELHEKPRLIAYIQTNKLGQELDKLAEYYHLQNFRSEYYELMCIYKDMSDRVYSESNSLVEMLASLRLVSKPRTIELKYGTVSGTEADTARYYLGASRGMYNDIVDSENQKTAAKFWLKRLVLSICFFLALAVVFIVILVFVIIINWRRGGATLDTSTWGNYLLLPASITSWLIFIVILNYRPLEYVPLDEIQDKLCTPLRNWVALAISIVLFSLAGLLNRLPDYKKVSYKNVANKSVFCVLLLLALVASMHITFWDKVSWADSLLFFAYSTGIAIGMWLVLMFGWCLIRKLPWGWFISNRQTQLLLITAFFAAIFSIVDFLAARIVLFFLLTSSIAVIITSKPCWPRPTLIQGFLTLLGRGEASCKMRGRLCKLSRSFASIGYICGILLLTFTTPWYRKVYSIEEEHREAQSIKANFLPTEETRQRVLKKTVGKSDSDLPNLYFLADPEELRQILGRITTLNPKAIKGNLGYEKYGYDSLPVLLDVINEPNSEEALFIRSRLGDKTAYDDLSHLLDIYRKRVLSESYDRAWAINPYYRILTALARISPAKEIETELMTVWGEYSGEWCFNFEPPVYLLKLLPQDMSEHLVKEYLKRSRCEVLERYNWMFRLPEYLFFLESSELASDAYTQMLEGPVIWNGQRYTGVEVCLGDVDILCTLSNVFQPRAKQKLRYKAIKEHSVRGDQRPELCNAIAPYLDRSSIPLLKQGIENSSKEMRAYSLWQLTRLGYTWTDDELYRFYEDEAYEVRANAVMAGSMDLVDRALNDKHPFVRLVARLRQASL